MALPAGNIIMPALENTGPPGSLKPFSSQGATALPPPLIQSFAALIRSAAGTMAWIRVSALALYTVTGSPLSRIVIASCGGTRRGTRWVPPAPGNRPTFTSGRPSRVLGLAGGAREWQARGEYDAATRTEPQ